MKGGSSVRGHGANLGQPLGSHANAEAASARLRRRARCARGRRSRAHDQGQTTGRSARAARLNGRRHEPCRWKRLHHADSRSSGTDRGGVRAAVRKRTRAGTVIGNRRGLNGLNGLSGRPLIAASRSLRVGQSTFEPEVFTPGPTSSSRRGNGYWRGLTPGSRPPTDAPPARRRQRLGGLCCRRLPMSGGVPAGASNRNKTRLEALDGRIGDRRQSGSEARARRSDGERGQLAPLDLRQRRRQVSNITSIVPPIIEQRRAEPGKEVGMKVPVIDLNSSPERIECRDARRHVELDRVPWLCDQRFTR